MDSLPIRAVSVPELDSRVHVFRYARLVDSFAVVTPELIAVIDTLVSPEAMAQVWSMLGVPPNDSRPTVVVNTHGDWDHAWGNGFFDGPDARRPAPVFGLPTDPQRNAALLATQRIQEPETYGSVRLRRPTVELAGEATIRAGDLTFSLFPTPGHSSDHLSVFIPELRVLFAGDAAEVPLPYIDEQSDVGSLRASLVRMKELDPTVVLYSHGAGTYSPEGIGRNIRYCDECEERCREWMAGGHATPPDPSALNWPLEAVVPAGVDLTAEDQEFYRTAHARAIATVFRSLLGGG